MESKGNRVAIVGGVRTPFVKAGMDFKEFSALELAVHSVNGLLEKEHLDPLSIDELVFGIVAVNPKLPSMAREIVFSSRLPSRASALTVTNGDITGISAVMSLASSIHAGRVEMGIAGGVESLSNPAMMIGKSLNRILMEVAAAKSFTAKVDQLLKVHLKDFFPETPGTKEPSTGLSRGEHVELMVKEWRVSRETQDEIAYRSHMKATIATEDGRLRKEIHPVKGVDRDLSIQPDLTLLKLSDMPPIFDPTPSGSVTAGNSSPLADGAASLLMMSEDKAQRENRKPLAFIKDVEFVAIDPVEGLLMGPAIAVPRLLRRTGLNLEDMEFVEFHEAFAGQVAANLKAWEQGWKEPSIGRLDLDRLNPLGGSLALGNPYSATAIRMITTMANEMDRRKSQYGLLTLGGGGAMAAAMILERAE